MPAELVQYLEPFRSILTSFPVMVSQRIHSVNFIPMPVHPKTFRITIPQRRDCEQWTSQRSLLLAISLIMLWLYGDMRDQKRPYGQLSTISQPLTITSSVELVQLSFTEIRVMSDGQLWWCWFKKTMNSSFHLLFILIINLVVRHKC